MERLPTFWVATNDQEEEQAVDRYICVRLRDEWLAVDDDQLIMPVTLLERDGEDLDPEPGLLKQYGGERLLNDLLMADTDFEAGTEWIIGYQSNRGRYIQPVD